MPQTENAKGYEKLTLTFEDIMVETALTVGQDSYKNVQTGFILVDHFDEKHANAVMVVRPKLSGSAVTVLVSSERVKAFINLVDIRAC